MFKNNISSKTPRILLFLYEILALALLFFYQIDKLDKYIFITGIIFILIIYISNYILSKLSSGDNYIFLIVTMLLSIGIIMIYRIDEAMGIRQLIWISLGIVVFYISYLIFKYIKIWDKNIYVYIGCAYILFLATLILGERRYGSINWITIAGINVQPAEIIKILLILIISTYYSNYDKYKENKNSSYYILGVLYSFIGFLFLQRDLGMAIIFYGIFISLQFIYEKNRKMIWYNLGVFLLGGIFAYLFFNHVQIRITTWIDPWSYMNTTGYQITQSLFAIAEGGFFGKGIGLGYPNFIPLSYNDFIFSAICEEMGIFTGIGIIMLFLILIYRGFKISIAQKNKFLKIMALGISILFGIQSIIILGGVMKLLPLTGVTLPFVSYGGSSIISNFIALGILQVASEDLDWKVEIDG